MAKQDEDEHRNYWEKNIRAFSHFYDKQSEEQVFGPLWVASLYRKILFPIEKIYMRKRFKMVSSYLTTYLNKQTRFADVGCGSGIFVRMAVGLGAKTLAIDYACAALDMVQENLKENEKPHVACLLLDVIKKSIPDVDVAIAIGLLTYIDDLDAFLDNILPHTNRILFNFMDASNILNRLRKTVKAIDVRKLSYHRREIVLAKTILRGFVVEEIKPLATGYMVYAVRSQASLRP